MQPNKISIPKIEIVKPDGSRFSIDTSLILAVIAVYIAARWLLAPLKGKFEQLLFDSPSYTSEVLGLLNQLLAVTDADRAILCLFHNGDKFLNGAHDVRATITHEVCSAGTEHISRKVRGIPISAISVEIEKMEAVVGKYHLTTENKAPTDCLRHMRQIGVSAIANYGIYQNNKQLGIISIQFTGDITLSPVEGRLKLKDVEVLTDLLYLKVLEKSRSPIRAITKLVLEKGIRGMLRI